MSIIWGSCGNHITQNRVGENGRESQQVTHKEGGTDQVMWLLLHKGRRRYNHISMLLLGTFMTILIVIE